MDELSIKLNINFADKVVKKDLTQKLKQSANVPIYVLKYLLGIYGAKGSESLQRLKVSGQAMLPNTLFARFCNINFNI